MSEVTEDKAAIDYALRYGGMCRDCADTRVRGICDNSGMPCDPAVCRKVIAHALGAWHYGIKHGFVHNPLSARASSSRAETVEPEAWKTQRYERGMWVETNLHLDEPTETSDLVVMPLYATPSSQGELAEARKQALEEAIATINAIPVPSPPGRFFAHNARISDAIRAISNMKEG